MNIIITTNDISLIQVRKRKTNSELSPKQGATGMSTGERSA